MLTDMKPSIELVLLDVDGVLLDYQRAHRVQHFARSLGVAAEDVSRLLFETGLETRYDSGQLDTATYLHSLSEGLQQVVSEADWIAARVAGCRPRPDVVQRLMALPGSLRLAVLTNNGALMAQVVAQLLPGLCARIGSDAVLCSGMLGGRKPDPAVFTRALQRLQGTAARTLFVDDLFTNVRGARSAGLHAETVRDGRGLGRVLRRYGLG